jgi:hypothetical protein
MMVRPIAAGNSANRSEEKRGVAWNGNTEKFNDTALTSGKEGNFGGVWGRGRGEERLEKYGTRSLQSI